MPSLLMSCGHLWKKTLHRCLPDELEAGDCWIALSLAQLSGLIRVQREKVGSGRIA